MTFPLAYDISTANNTTLVRVDEGIFADNRDQLMATLLQIADNPDTHIVIDLSKCRSATPQHSTCSYASTNAPPPPAAHYA